MKILFLGAIGEGQTSLMRLGALRRLGHEVVGVETSQPWSEASWAARQTQRRLCRGPIVDGINNDVLEAARALRPDLVWAEKQEFLRPETVAALDSAQRVHFTPDPYFFLSWRRTPLMDAAIGCFDQLIYCKAYERPDYERLGKPLIYMPLGYCDEVHRPLPSSDPALACAVGFLGGWEPRRARMLHALAEAVGDVQIRGGYWDFLRDGRWTPRRQVALAQLAGGEPFQVAKDELLGRAWRGGEVYADDYARALTAARIGVGFLRQTWPDQHTTRSFEIPACASLLLADRTEEHLGFFEEGREAEFFSEEAELVDKARFYAAHETERARIAAAGRERCERSGYAYIERLRPVIAEIVGRTTPRPRAEAVAPAKGLTLVIPLYNGREFLGELLPSLALQADEVHAFVFVDDGSTDDTLSAVKAFGLPKARYVENAANLGLYGTLNFALSLVETDLVGLVFQDDVPLEGYAAEMKAVAARRPDASFFTSGFRRIDLSGATLHTPVGSGREWTKASGVASWRDVLINGTSWIISGSVSRTEALRRYGFRPEMPQCGDFELFIRAAREESFVYLDRVLVAIREHPTQASVGNLFRSIDLIEKILILSEQRRTWPGDFTFSFRLRLFARYAYYVAARSFGQLRRGRWAALTATVRLGPRLVKALWGASPRPRRALISGAGAGSTTRASSA